MERRIWGKTDEEIESAPIEELQIKDLIPTQFDVYVDGLDYKVKNQDTELPVVVKCEGKLYLEDHTRVVAAIVNGKTSIEAKILERDR